MNIENLTPSSGNGAKGILAKNEKAVAWVVGAGIFAALVWVGVKIIPWVLAAALNFLWLGLIAGGVALVWYNMDYIKLRYQLVIKKMWRSVVKSDPISIMKLMWKKWTKKRVELNDSIQVMKAGEDELLAAMDENQAKAKDKFAIAKQALELETKRQDANYGRKATKNSIIANRLNLANKDLLPRLQYLQKTIAYCTDLYDHWGDDLEMLKEDITLKEQTLKLYASTSNAIDSAKSILNDNPDERAMWEMATEATAEKVSNYVANITRFTEQAKDWVYDKDIQSAVWEDEGKQLLSMYDQDTFNQLTDFRSLMLKPEDQSFAQASNSFQTALAQPMPQKSSQTFRDL